MALNIGLVSNLRVLSFVNKTHISLSGFHLYWGLRASPHLYHNFCTNYVNRCRISTVVKNISSNFNENSIIIWSSSSVLSLKTPQNHRHLLGALCLQFKEVTRELTYHHIDRPKPETTFKNLRFKVHYPEDGVYTIKPLRMTRLGGRDPETGRLIFGKIGGGHKRNFRWVILDRVPPGSKDPLIEKVIHVQYDPNRTARIALVGHDDKLRYIIATATMKAGDLITSTRELPPMPILPKEGNAHPVGALPVGTMICCIERLPGIGASVKLAAGTNAIVGNKLEQKIIVTFDSKRKFALDRKCLVTVGQVSNPDHKKKHIGSAQRARWLGIRPSSGLWQRKTGRFGRKIRPPTLKHVLTPKPSTTVIRLTLRSEEPSQRVIPATERVT